MGLDSVEMVIRVEDRFGINIPDEAAQKMETVGQLFDFLQIALNSTPSDRCKTQHIFYRFRRWLPNHQKADFHPQAPITFFLGNKVDPLVYKSVSKELNLIFPSLRPPGWLFWGFSFPIFVGWLVLLITSFYFGENLMFILALVLVAQPLIDLQSFLYSRLSDRIPAKTTREFIQAVTAFNYKTVIPKYHNKKDVWNTLVEVIVETTGVELQEVTYSAHFSKDLGID